MDKKWPWPGDAPVARARKIAWAYRAAVEKAGLHDELKELDARFSRYGERWIAPGVPVGPDDYVDAPEAAALIGISSGAISKLRSRGRLKGVIDGRRFRYKVSDVYALSDGVRRRATNGATDIVTDNGRSVSSDDPTSDERTTGRPDLPPG